MRKIHDGQKEVTIFTIVSAPISPMDTKQLRIYATKKTKKVSLEGFQLTFSLDFQNEVL